MNRYIVSDLFVLFFLLLSDCFFLFLETLVILGGRGTGGGVSIYYLSYSAGSMYAQYIYIPFTGVSRYLHTLFYFIYRVMMHTHLGKQVGR